MECGNCLSAEVYAKDRCHTCYRYRWRTGRERPIERVITANRRAIEGEMERNHLKAIYADALERHNS